MLLRLSESSLTACKDKATCFYCLTAPTSSHPYQSMARKSSRDKRLVDKSQARTRGTGNGLTGRHGGVPAPTSGDRGNSTNRAEGSSAVRRSGQTQEHSASNSATGKSRTKGHVQGNTTGSHAEDSSTGQTQPATQEHSASPESQTRDSDQESTNASEIDSDEQQRESCSNLSDHDEPLDPGNRKRKLGQAITEILVSSLKKIKTSYVSICFDVPTQPSSFTGQTRMSSNSIAPHAASPDSLVHL